MTAVRRPDRNRLSWLSAAFAVLALSFAGEVSAQESTAPAISISPISGNLHLVKAGSEATVVLVTDAGIILVDSLSDPIARALKKELSERFPDRAVRYLVHTSHRFDRASGGVVFKDTVETIGQESFGSELSRSRGGLTSVLAPLDVNHDGKLTASELGSASVAASVLSKDRDGDGFVTPDELYRNVQEPRTVFARMRELRLGGESITLVHAPLTEERDAVVVLFPSQRLAFASIVPAIAPLPAPFGVNSPKDLDRWFRQMNGLSFDRLISGTGDEFSHEQIAGAAADLAREYDRVTAAVRKGQSLQQVQGPAAPASPGVSRPVRDEQVASLYRSLHRVTTSLYGVTSVHVSSEAIGTFCKNYVCCTTGTPSQTQGGGGVSVTAGPFGFDASLLFRPQYTIEREVPLYAEIIAYRETAGTAVARYAVRPWLFVVGGVTQIKSSAAGVSIVRALNERTSGRAPISRDTTDGALTFGMDCTIGRLLFPLRASHFSGPGSATTNSRNVSEWQFDIGVGFVVFRNTHVLR